MCTKNGELTWQEMISFTKQGLDLGECGNWHPFMGWDWFALGGDFFSAPKSLGKNMEEARIHSPFFRRWTTVEAVVITVYINIYHGKWPIYRLFSQLETSIYKGFSMAMLNNQRVSRFSMFLIWCCETPSDQPVGSWPKMGMHFTGWFYCCSLMCGL